MRRVSYTAARILYTAVIFRTGLRAAAVEGSIRLPESYRYVAVIFPRIAAAGRMKTDLVSELKFLQLLAELGEEGLVLPGHHAGSTHQIKNPRDLSNNLKRRNRGSTRYC